MCVPSGLFKVFKKDPAHLLDAERRFLRRVAGVHDGLEATPSMWALL